MNDIRHRVGMKAPAERVYQELATSEGLSRWWTERVEGESGVGERLAFFFGGEEPGAVMEVTELEPGLRVGWRGVDGAQEWLGTTFTFDLREEQGETVVLFTHAGWREPSEFMHHCSTAWSVFLLGLKAGMEGGTATPFPHQPAISKWG